MNHKRLVSADWILPMIAPPLRDGAVVLDGGTIREVGPAAVLRARYPDLSREELGRAIVLPGLVNAHTHLSLTGLLPPRGGGFFEWLGAVAREAREMSEAAVRASVRAGAEACWRTGTVLVGEIATRPEGVEEIVRHGHLGARVYFEFLGVRETTARSRFAEARAQADRLVPARPDGPLRPGLSPHAPYSVWPALWEETAALARARDLPWSTHLAEAPGEEQFLREGRGPIRDYLEGLGVWDDAFPIPGCGALDLLGPALDARALVVHGVHLEPAAMDLLAASGAALCLCPRSNAVLGLPPAPAADLFSRGVPLALGTDSLASNEDLSLWGEMRALRVLAPGIPAAAILRMATLNGARALGMEDRGGAIRPGAPASLLAVEAPDLGAADPAEYLVRERVDDRVHHLE